MQKRFLAPILVTIFSFSAFTRIDGSESIKPVLFVTILAIGMGLGVLLKTLLELYQERKK
ncbi:MAG: hypothetical protein KDC34_15365 [Saprospiraceae bacterium]|nr:hypothetical protein [Saprospiraceae bacterium]